MKKLLNLFICFLTIVSGTNVYANTKTDLNNYVSSSVISGLDKIDVSAYKIKKADAIQLTTILMQTNFDMYRVKKISCKTDNTYVKYFVFSYDSAAIANTPMINDAISDIVKKANELDNTYQKIKFVYDYMINTYDYDFELNNHNVNELLTTGKGVCTAYAMLFDEIMNQLNIPSKITHNASHAWNLVLLDGEWYNIDCSTPDITLIQDFRYATFLKSDKYFALNGISIMYDCNNCTSEKYDFYEVV